MMKDSIRKFNKASLIACRTGGAVLLILILFTANAQSPLDQCGPTRFTGFDSSFGMRAFSLTSDLGVLNNLDVVQEGGSLGGVFGNNFFLVKVRGGLYYSNGKTPNAIDITELETMVNFYPINLLKPYHQHIMDFYLALGTSMDIVSFYGNYIDGSKPQNYSAVKQPYLGKMSLMNVTAGAGIEFRMRGKRDFGHFFAEVKQGIPLYSSTKSEAFKNTSIRSITFVNIGVSYGFRK